MNLERLIEFQPAFDKRSDDPSKNYGVHGVTLRFLVKGDLGAIQFVIYTNWQLPHVTKEHKRKAEAGIYPFNTPTLFAPMAADLGYHSPKSMYDGQTPMSGECDVFGGTCYYDGSGLRAQGVFDLLVSEGHEAMWKLLESEYAMRFETVEVHA